jgi:uncharacterized membrane protein YdjX (TVP38/TMEM64 family)
VFCLNLSIRIKNICINFLTLLTTSLKQNNKAFGLLIKHQHNEFLRRILMFKVLPSKSKFSMLQFILMSILGVTAILALVIYAGFDAKILLILQWFDDHNTWAPTLFVLLMATVVVLILPGIWLTMGAGVLFGVVHGSLYVILGTTLGASISFLVARFFFGTHSQQYIARRQTKLKFITDHFKSKSWKIVFITRLIPFFPAKLANYFFGLTRCSFLHYVFATFIGIIPFSVHSVYLGSIVTDIATLGSRNNDRSQLQWALYILGFLVTLAIVIYLGRKAARHLNNVAQEQIDYDESQPKKKESKPCSG